MSMVDPFIPSAFTLTSLTAAINNLKYQPRRLSSLFEETSVSTTNIAIEERNGTLSLLTPRPRGATGAITGVETRKIIPFAIPHIPVRGSLYADEVQGIRAFGTENVAETLNNRIAEKLQDMRNAMDYTIESHRCTAIKGNYINANGDTVSLFTTFNVVQQTQAMAFSSTVSSEIRSKMMAISNKIDTALDGGSWSGMLVLCSDDFWVAMLEDKDIKSTYLNQMQAAELRGNPSDVFTAYGATWERYRGTSSVNFGSDAYLIPGGIDKLCVTYYAPADYVETVNTNGIPYYVKSEPIPFGKGYEFEAQSNPLNLITRPAAIIKLTIN